MRPPHLKVDILNARLESHLSTHAFCYLTLAAYVLATALVAVWGFHDEFTYNSPDNNLRYYISLARAAGYTLNLNAALVILMAARLLTTSLRNTPLRNLLPFDHAFPAFHIIVAYAIALALLVHVPFHLVWLIAYSGWEPGLWGHTMSATTGFVLLAIFLLMLVTSLPRIRAAHFRLFHITHIISAAIFFPLLIVHGVYRRVPYTYKWITAPLILYLLDRLLRRLKISTHTLALSRTAIPPPTHDILALRLPRPFTFRAGQYAELRVPALASEWHPFTIASAPHEDHVVFFIKALGDWTRRLHALCDTTARTGPDQPPDHLTVQIRGPYGAPVQHVGGYERVVLISGGVGSTPFASICKHLHHRNVTENHEKKCNDAASLDGMESVEARIRSTLTELYDVEINTKGHYEPVEEQRQQYLADMLNLTAISSTEPSEEPLPEPPSRHVSEIALEEGAGSIRSIFSGEKRCGSDCGCSFVINLSDTAPLGRPKTSVAALKSARQRLARLYERRSRLLAFLHTTRVSFVLLLTILIRIALVCMVPILNMGRFSLSDSHIDQTWIIATETTLGFILGFVLFTTISLEISYMGRRYFRRRWRVLDFIAFLPLTLLHNILGVLAWTGRKPSDLLAFVHYIVLLPFMLLLLAYRMYRTIGARTLLDDSDSCGCSCHSPVPDVDFIWTTPHDSHDQWLRDELGPLATGTELRLHRYVTREKKGDLEAGEAFIEDNTGRPDWDEMFDTIARRVPSHGKVGVFFCGPQSMGKSVMKSLHKVEVQSNLRGAYLNTTRDKILVDDLGISDWSDIRNLRAHGCNVRFVFREENF